MNIESKVESISIIVPTYNEAENIPELVRRISKFTNPINILVVDDNSPDGTADVALNSGCMVLRRTGNKGLSASVIDGLKWINSSKIVIVVMDADLQHPPEIIPDILKALDTHDFAVTDRTQGSFNMSFKRRVTSFIAKLLAMPLLPKVKDPTTGYFGFRREALPDNLNVLSPKGWKIMLELLVKGKAKSIAQVPLKFGQRLHGESKLSNKIIKEYLTQLISLYLYKWRWIRFGLIGLSGTGIYFPILYTLTEFTVLPYIASAVVGIVCASTSNYFLNHFWTFSGQRSAAHNHFLGWGKYQLMSGITDGAYLGLMAILTELGGMWYMLSAGVAIVIIFIAKYMVARHWIWSRKSKLACTKS